MEFSADAIIRAQKIKMVVFDVDGVLTDGCIYMGNDGELMKSFSARDGMGITLLHRAGLNTAIITGRKSDIVANRAGELRITALWQGCSDKREAYAELKQKFDLSNNEIAYVGDDLNDLPLMQQVGLACSVGDGMPEARAVAHVVADAYGGHGAVREIVEFILKSQGKWEELVASFSGAALVKKIAQ